MSYAAIHLYHAKQTANPWPTLDEAIEYGKACSRRWFEALIQAEGPRRPFPAAPYAPKPAPVAMLLRIDASKLPVMPIAFWSIEQQIHHEHLRQEWLLEQQLAADRNQHAFEDSPWPGEQPLTRKQRLGRWLDAHRGALKPWGRKKKAPPLPVLDDNEPEAAWAPQERWAR